MIRRYREFIPGPSSLMLLALILGLIGWLLHDTRGVPYGWVGGVVWAGALLLTFLLGVAFLSRRLLPVQGNLGWSEGFRLLWRNYFLNAAQFLAGRRHEPLVSTIKKKPKTPMLSPSFSLLGAGFLFSHEAAAITRGNSYQRADGPGLVFLLPGESIAQIFDLRTQSRKMPVSATTRDGIPVETSVSVSFRVRRLREGERRPRSIETDTIPYRYDRDAIFDLNYAASVAGDDERLPWTEQVCPQAATLLVGEIGRYTLDELLVSAGAEPMGKIKENIKTALLAQQDSDEGQVLSKGIEILSVGVGGLELHEDVVTDVVTKRLATWQVTWQNKVTNEVVGADIEVTRQYHQARAQAFEENVENLLQLFETARHQSAADYHQVAITQLIEVLERVMAGQLLKRMESRTQLFSQASDTQSQLRQILENEG